MSHILWDVTYEVHTFIISDLFLSSRLCDRTSRGRRRFSKSTVNMDVHLELEAAMKKCGLNLNTHTKNSSVSSQNLNHQEPEFLSYVYLTWCHSVFANPLHFYSVHFCNRTLFVLCLSSSCCHLTLTYMIQVQLGSHRVFQLFSASSCLWFAFWQNSTALQDLY